MIAPLEKIGDSSDPLTLQEFRNDLSLKLLKMNPRALDVDIEGGEEVGLFAGDFKGKCHHCGRQGHKSCQCKDKKMANGGNATGGGGGAANSGDWEKRQTCFCCKQKGHITTNCPKLKAKREKEKAMCALDEGVALTVMNDLVPGERLAFDVSSIKSRSYGGAKFWLLVMDDCTGFIWSHFLKHKSQVKDKMVELIKHLKMKFGHQVKFLRCDNAEEECMQTHPSKMEELRGSLPPSVVESEA